MATQLKRRTYTLEMLRDEARELVDKGLIDRQQPIHALCRFVPQEGWKCVELELELNEYLLRDHIIDLLAKEDWSND